MIHHPKINNHEKPQTLISFTTTQVSYSVLALGSSICTARQCIVFWKFPEFQARAKTPRNPKIHLSEYPHDPTVNQAAKGV